jgi:hypothetical protein
MAHGKKNINTNITGMSDYMPVPQAESEKVVTTVNTFFSEESVKVPDAEKVTNMVGTFLNEDRDSFRIIKVTTKADG